MDITAKREGVCAKCGRVVNVGDAAVWSPKERGVIYCVGCGSTNNTQTDNKGKGSTAEGTTTESSQRQSREESIKKDHEDTIAATYALINVVKELVNELKNINYHLTVRP